VLACSQGSSFPCLLVVVDHDFYVMLFSCRFFLLLVLLCKGFWPLYSGDLSSESKRGKNKKYGLR